MRALAAQRDIRIELEPLADAPARGDPELIGRLLLNLLDNAIKYSPKGSTVTVSLSEREQSYQVSVADRGAGIPADALPFVFDRFYRVDKARSRTDFSLTSGAGLGLALARWIAEAHGGRLEIVRSDATGSEFRFTLPAAQVAAPDPILSQV
jgi:signal transduction histidine kinase